MHLDDGDSAADGGDFNLEQELEEEIERDLANEIAVASAVARAPAAARRLSPEEQEEDDLYNHTMWSICKDEEWGSFLFTWSKTTSKVGVFHSTRIAMVITSGPSLSPLFWA